jgi:CRP/FNR family transcriptional regulator, cyclic AMP receptor protein
MKSLWFFEDVNLFTILCPHRYKEYKNEHNFCAYKKNDFVYFEEEDADSIYLINSGKVKIGYVTEEGEEVITGILSKGEIFGEKAILGETSRNEFAQSVSSDTSICNNRHRNHD